MHTLGVPALSRPPDGAITVGPRYVQEPTMAALTFRGINHLALVCADMDRTVEFYTKVLDMPLTKTIELPGGRGKHYFFDCGGGDQLAFFWFPDGPDAVTGKEFRRITSTPGTMNHVAFDVAPEDLERYRDRLVERGVECTEVVNHDDGDEQIGKVPSERTFVRSVYFRDPDGTQLEIAAWTRVLGPQDVAFRSTCEPEPA
jgi:catechol 2,3-dioxygenase-like lactoylglutathione lyase family enzyme